MFCFNEAVAIAGLSIIDRPTSKAEGAPIPEPPQPDRSRVGPGQKVDLAVPAGQAVIGTFNGIPYVKGKVPIVRKPKQ